MWQRIRKKYFIALVLLAIAYPISFAPSLYYLLHYAEPTTASVESFQKMYPVPIKILPPNITAGLIQASGYPRPTAVKFAQRIHAGTFRAY